MKSSDLAKRAYEAYGEEAGWKVFDGKPMKAWEDATPRIRNNWRASAVEIAKLLGCEIIFDREE